MTREEAITYGERKKARIQEKLCRDGCSYGDHSLYYSEMEFTSAALSALREQEERRWIPVKERFPKLIPSCAGTAYSEAVNVLTTGRKVLTAIYDGTDFIADDEFWDAEGEEITHWTPVLLPLPEPPKEDSK